MSSSRPPEGGPPFRDSSSGTRHDLEQAERARAVGKEPSGVQRDRDAALHVRDARPVAATLVAAERPRSRGAQRKDGVVVAEQRDRLPGPRKLAWSASPPGVSTSSGSSP